MAPVRRSWVASFVKAMATSSPAAAVLRGHTNSVWACAFSHDGSHLATTSSDETARVWSLLPLGQVPSRGQEVACLHGYEGVVRGCDFSPDSALLATGSWDKSIHIHICSNFSVSIPTCACAAGAKVIVSVCVCARASCVCVNTVPPCSG